MSDLREGGDLSRKFQAPRRAWLLVNLVVTAALLPALFVSRGDSGPDAQAVRAGTFDTVAVSAMVGDAAAADVEAILDELAPVPTTAPPTTAPPPTTTTTARPHPRPTTAPRPAVRPAQVEASPTTTTTRPPSTTTTTRPPSTTTTAAPPAGPAVRTESGKATWYHQRSGVCAHKKLPFGTRVTVTNTRNGRTTQCTVGDRGPFVEGYIIDLAPEQFDQVSARSAGVFPAKISW